VCKQCADDCEQIRDDRRICLCFSDLCAFVGGADPAFKLSQRHDGITICNPLVGLECFHIHGLENRLEKVRDPFFPLKSRRSREQPNQSDSPNGMSSVNWATMETGKNRGLRRLRIACLLPFPGYQRDSVRKCKIRGVKVLKKARRVEIR
jgi:hypothetical protein